MNDDRQETLRKIDAWVIRFLSKGHLFGKRLQVQTEPNPLTATSEYTTVRLPKERHLLSS